MRQTHDRSRQPARSLPGQGVPLEILAILLVTCATLATPLAAEEFAPQPVLGLVHVQPFQLETSFPFDWRSERPAVQSGLLVVLRVDPDLVAPRNALEPVLYAGNQTVQRLNQGHDSGVVVGIIPGQMDLSTEPVWFGTPALPEAVDAAVIASERARAERAGIRPLTTADKAAVVPAAVVASDLTTLLREQAAGLVLQHSPQEARLANSWRLPVNNR
ncbi:MAG: hypothetical protein AAGF23_02900 [Acidobacteriota bacterium]